MSDPKWWPFGEALAKIGGGGGGAGSGASGGSGSAPSPSHAKTKDDLKKMDGYAQQSAALSPDKAHGGWLGDFFGLKSGAGKGQDQAADKKADPRSVVDPSWPWPWPGAAKKPNGPTEVGIQAGTHRNEASMKDVGRAAEARDEASVELPPDLPNDFGSESALRAWIGEFNRSLEGMSTTTRARFVAKLKTKKWGGESGMTYELLAAAAMAEPAPVESGKKGAAGAPLAGEAPALPGPVLNARILAMLSRDNAALFGGIQGYSGLCLQFSAKLMEKLGAKRLDGTSAKDEKIRSPEGPLTGRYRNWRVKQLPENLPAGYQVCVVSRPDWGFTEVGNHWFISAGHGYYLDDVMGVTNGTQMEASLINTTADQWAQRVVGKNTPGSVRDKMGARFAQEHSAVSDHRRVGRSPNESKKKLTGGRDNPEFKEADAAETAGAAAVKAIVNAQRDVYAPRVWIVEPTTKADGP